MNSNFNVTVKFKKIVKCYERSINILFRSHYHPESFFLKVENILSWIKQNLTENLPS